MTNAAYRAKYRRLRAHLGKVALSEQAVVRKQFKALGQPIADAVKRIPSTPSLGDEDRKRILGALDRNALFDSVKASIVSGVKKGGKYIVDLETAYVWEAVQKAKAEKRFREAGIRKVFDRQLDKIVKRKANTGKMMPLRNAAGKMVYANRAGFTLSSSIWKIVSRFETQIMAIVEGGLNQGRDGRDISGDLMAYIIGGPDAVLGRWGNLLPGTGEYIARLGTAGVDYRAMRLVRSEMYSSMQEDAVSSGRANPAGNGLFDWILQAGRIDWPCDCPSLADGGPYEAEDVPDYPHPSCGCTVAVQLIDHDDFVNSLADFVAGRDTQGAQAIEDWAQKFYDATA